MSFLDEILAWKCTEVEKQKAMVPLDILEKSVYLEKEAVSLVSALRDRKVPGIIAEFKRMSPSAGQINVSADPVEVAKAYQAGGAAGLSVLTDGGFFGGSTRDLEIVRPETSLPVLRKDFIIDEYQVVESRAIGADVILLIAAAHRKKRLRELARLAGSVGLEVLLEIHEERELEILSGDVGMVGVNNRDLKRMATDTRISRDLAGKIPGDLVKISESGIGRAETIRELWDLGYSGFLVGEHFMRKEDPGAACRELNDKLK